MATSKSPMDMVSQLSMGQKLIAGGGILMLIASFLPWYKVSFSVAQIGFSTSVSRSGWQSPGGIWSILAVLLAVAMAGVVIARLANVALPDLGSVTWGQAMLGGGVAVAVLVVIKLLNHSSNLSFGFFLGIIAAVALAAGGYLLYSEERTGAGAMR
jgi:hypothetical protein